MDRRVADGALQATFARISATRERQAQMRLDRSEQLARLAAYLRATLATYLTTVDPISGSRLVDVGIDESKTQGGLAVVLAMFDGSKFKISVDALGRFTHAAVPEIFAAVGKIVEVRVSKDLSSAELCYLAPGEARGPVRLEPVETFLLAMITKSAETVEGQAGDTISVAPSA